MDPRLSRLYSLRSRLTAIRFTEGVDADAREIEEELERVLHALVAETPPERRGGLLNLARSHFFRPEPHFTAGLGEWIRAVDAYADGYRREREQLQQAQIRRLEEPARIGLARQEHARSLRRKQPQHRYREVADEYHRRFPHWSYNDVCRQAAIDLGVDSSTVKKNIGPRSW